VGEFFVALFYGIRFDVVAVTAINALFILLVAFPVSFFYKKGFRVFLKWLFMVVNALAFVANLIDVAYFPYTLRRTTPDTITFFIEKNDAGTLLPVFLADFWYLILIFVLYLIAVSWLYNFIQRRTIETTNREERGEKRIAINSLYFVLISAFSVLGIRGGTQLIPLGIIDAGNFVRPQLAPLVLSTPFCLIKSGELYTLEEKNYMPEAEVLKYFNPEKKYAFADADFKAQNVVVIIVESLSKEYTKLAKRKSYTPFLDSLMDHSFVFTHAFANGKRSIEGIPAVLASLPSFQYDYISTVYSNNRIMSLASILKDKKYFSSFFHGGTNGTMNFDGFCATAGFDRYFGRKEYADEKDYDGDWGIWDEPFLQRMALELDKQPQPFASAVFTLSSHHPYKVPEKYKDKFPDGKLPIFKCIAYADYSLQKFFDAIKKQKWFSNTLFVITGDHTGVSEDPVYNNPYGNYLVPVIFYKPDDSLKGQDDYVTQQTDIMPGILHQLRYNKPFFSFGNNPFDTLVAGKRCATNYFSVAYQFYSDQYLLQFNGEKTVAIYDYRRDSTLSSNLINNSVSAQEELENRMKAFIQLYNNRVIHNRTYVK
jgi:phosphoglycerol transferase MdoB-like AlkP superfamily enzyme